MRRVLKHVYFARASRDTRAEAPICLYLREYFIYLGLHYTSSIGALTFVWEMEYK